MQMMLINYDEQYSKKLHDIFVKFKEIDCIDCFISGKSATQELTKKSYDIVVFDLFLPEKDGIDILHTIKQMQYSSKPILIGLSSTKNKTVINNYLELGIDYLFFEPFNNFSIENRVKLIIKDYSNAISDENESLKITQKNIIKDNLAQYKFKINTLGYKYLLEAVTLCVEDEALLKNITKGLYNEIAEKHNTTFYSVERSIRHLLKSQFARDEEPFKKITKNGKHYLTNSQFITYVVANMSFYLI